LDFCHFEMRSDGHEGLGVPPPMSEDEELKDDPPQEKASQVQICVGEDVNGEAVEAEEVPKDLIGVENREKNAPWTYSQARFMGKSSVFAIFWNADVREFVTDASSYSRSLHLNR